MCPACRQPVAECLCRQTRLVPPSDGVVRVSCETRGRGGKSVTVVRGLALDAPALAQLGKQLRTACGAGGTAKDGVLEVQGDHGVLVVAWLEKQGWKAKKAGGKAA